MNKIIIKAAEISNGDEFHKLIATALKLPYYYGNNLDALHDCLTDTTEKTVIEIDDLPLFKANLGKYGDRILRVIKDSARENECIVFDEKI